MNGGGDLTLADKPTMQCADDVYRVVYWKPVWFY